MTTGMSAVGLRGAVLARNDPGRVLTATIAVGILQLPTPMVGTHLGQRPRRLPAQGFSRKRRVGITDGDITDPAFSDFIRNTPAAHGLECPNDLQNAAAVACSKIECQHSGLLQMIEDAQMAGRKVDDMNEISDSGTVRSVIVVSPNVQLFSFSNRHLR